MNFARTQICSLDKRSLKDIACSNEDELIRLPPHLKYLQWYQVALDSITAKNFNRNNQNKIKTP